MAKQTVLLLGATGETGESLLNGLLADDSYEVSALIRESSLDKTAVQELVKAQDVRIVVGDASADVPSLTKACTGFDIVVSAIDAFSQLDQINLVEAAKAAGVKRFVPCGWMTTSPRGGILALRDAKEEVQDRIHQLHLPYTYIDCGYWHSLSFPNVPSGKFNYAQLLGNKNEIVGDPDMKSLLSHAPDIGKWTARILKDERTLNQRVLVWADELSQKEIVEIVERTTGEKLEVEFMSTEELAASLKQAREHLAANPAKTTWDWNRVAVSSNEYRWSKYVRGDNRLDYARYLGYLDAKELYPDFKPVSFEEFIRDVLLPGKAVKPYRYMSWAQ